MASYMKLNNLKYTIDSRFAAQDNMSRAKFKDLIEFIEVRSKWIRGLEEYNLSSSHFRRMDESMTKATCASIKTVCEKHNVKANDLMWTRFKDSASRLVNTRNILHKPYGREASEADKAKCFNRYSEVKSGMENLSSSSSRPLA